MKDRIFKGDIAEMVAERTGLSKKDAEAAVNATFESISERVAAGYTVNLHRFGTFEKKARKERTGRNPVTKKPMVIEAKNAVAFHASATMKEAVNQE